jgi:hypothetical protein
MHRVNVCSAPASQALRWLRAVLLGGVTVLTGTVAHATAGGLLPSAAAMAALMACSVLLSAAVLGRTASIGLLVGFVAGGQTVIHVVLSVMSGHADEPAQPIAWTVDGLSSTAGAMVADLGAHAPMMMAHFVAATGVALWLSVGERALWSILHSVAVIVLRPLLLALLALRRLPATAPLGRVSVLPDTPGFPAHLPALARSVVRRGPPLVLAA